MNIFWYKTIALALLLLGLQIAAGSSWFQFTRITTLDGYLSAHKDIIFLGDSIPGTVPPQDTDLRTLPQMVEDETGKSIGNFSYPGYGTGVFEDVVTYIARQKDKPEAIILPVNLSTFSTINDRRPEYGFEKEKFYFTAPQWLHAFYRPLSILRYLNMNTIPREESAHAPIFFGTEAYTTLGDFDALIASSTVPIEVKRKEIYKARYLYALQENDEKLIPLEHALDTAARAGIQVYVYITPMDYEKGEQQFGALLKKQVSENAGLVCALAEKKNAPCLNLAFSVPQDGFSSNAIADEHMNQSGRARVADAISAFFFKK